MPKPIALIILDGFGVAAPTDGNAITSAKMPYWDYLLANYPSTLLQASGAAVGLPFGKMGNSEVGHLTIGSGQIFTQSLDKINKQISTGEFFKNHVFLDAIEHVKKHHSRLHLIGLLGDGGVHAHQNHLYALLDLAKNSGLDKTYLHLFLDGRDTAKDQGLGFLEELKQNIDKMQCCQIASISGRYYGMDRNNNWDRTKLAFATMIGESSSLATDPIQAIKDSYAKNIFDEEFVPVMMTDNNKPIATISNNDAVIFFNFRSDRARQLTKAFVLDDFDQFDRGQKIQNLFFVGFSEYERGLPIEVAYPRPNIEDTLAKIISDNSLKQLHLAETEKYAHVTFFLNGLKEDPFPGEERILIPSPSVASYDLKPAMSGEQIKNSVLTNLPKNEFDFYVVNFANPDMVGHTGNLVACKQALEATDGYLNELIESILKAGGEAIVTADHGNVEEVINLETGAIDKEHSNFPVPCVIIKDEYKGKSKPHKNQDLHTRKIKGALVDIAPTVLSMLGIPKSDKMIGIDLNKVL